MSKYLSEVLNFRIGLAAAADRWNGNPATDLVDLSKYESVAFIVHQNDAALGTANPTITIEAASANDGTGAEAVAFKYRQHAETAAVGSLTDATASGVALTAGDNRLLIAEVKADDLPDGKPWVRAVATEGVDDAATGAVFVVMGKPRYTDGNPPAAL